jgi:nitrogen fixation NifU-like protein
MNDLDTLYGEVILDHNRRPRHFGTLDDARRGEGHNPVCGDRLTVFVRLRDGVIADASFQGFGCAIAMATASLMTDYVIGKTVADAEAMFGRLRRLIAASADTPVDDLGPLSALAGIRRFPVRLKCATLPWQALLAAASPDAGPVVSTE